MKKVKEMARRIKVRYILLFAGLISLAGLFLIQYESWRTVTYTIPSGVGAGKVTLDIPDEIVLTVGIKDTVVIKNQDDAVHRFGPFVIGPESTLTHRFRSPRLYEAVCTFHQDQQMRVVINPAFWSPVFWNGGAFAEQ